MNTYVCVLTVTAKEMPETTSSSAADDDGRAGRALLLVLPARAARSSGGAGGERAVGSVVVLPRSLLCVVGGWLLSIVSRAREVNMFAAAGRSLPRRRRSVVSVAAIVLVVLVSVAAAASRPRKEPAEPKEGDPGMPCMHGKAGVCGVPSNCTTTYEPGYCLGNSQNQCCLAPKKYDAVRMDRPTSDFDDTPDDLTYCDHLDFCNHHGRCNIDLKECICDDMWLGDRCERIVNYNTSAGPVTVTIIEHEKPTPKMDGNEYFLAKAHHRLRQVMALLKIMPTEKRLLTERERLIDRLGMRHLLLERSVHTKIVEDPGALAGAVGATNDTLPVILTTRLKDIAPTDAQLTATVNQAMGKALRQAIADSTAGKAETFEKPINPMLQPDLTLLDKKKMVATGVKAQIKNGNATIGITTGKILRDRSNEGHLEEGMPGNDIEHGGMISVSQRDEHFDVPPGFDVQFMGPKDVPKPKESESKEADDYNAEIAKQFNKVVYGKKSVPKSGPTESEQLAAAREEEERRVHDVLHQIDDWNQYPNTRQPRVQNDYLNKELASRGGPNVGDEAPMPHKEFKNVEPPTGGA